MTVRGGNLRDPALEKDKYLRKGAPVNNAQLFIQTPSGLNPGLHRALSQIVDQMNNALNVLGSFTDENGNVLASKVMIGKARMGDGVSGNKFDAKLIVGNETIVGKHFSSGVISQFQLMGSLLTPTQWQNLV
jgi:hypothetical protein